MKMDKIIIISGIILYSVFNTSGDVITPNGAFKTNCFSNEETGRCEDCRVKICSSFYACDMSFDLSVAPRRISFENSDIYVTAGSKTYAISNGEIELLKIRKFLSSWEELYDNNNNRYYTAHGTTYVVQESDNEIEIVTTGTFSSNQLALDNKANKLFILAYNNNNSSNANTGNLYAIRTDPLDIVDGVIRAEKVEGIENDITALSVEGGLDKLLLGLKTEDGGKIIRLKQLKSDPCSMNVKNQSVIIMDFMKETGSKLVKLLQSNNAQLTRVGPNPILNENVRLKRELEVTKSKLHSFFSRLSSVQNFDNVQQSKKHGVIQKQPIDSLINGDESDLCEISCEEFYDLEKKNMALNDILQDLYISTNQLIEDISV